jgi:DNA-binding transcriptional MerR regulator
MSKRDDGKLVKEKDSHALDTSHSTASSGDTSHDNEILDYVRTYRGKEFTYDEIRTALLDQEVESKTIKWAIAESRRIDKENLGTSSAVRGIVAFVFLYLISLGVTFFLLKQSGLEGVMFFTPMSSFFSLIDGTLNIDLVSFFLSGFFISLAMGSYIALQFKRTSMKVLYLLPISMPFFSFIFFGFSRFALVSSISLCAVHYYITIDVERRVDAYKKPLPFEISSQTIQRCLLPAFVIMASFVGLMTYQDASFAELEIQRIFISAGFDTENVETLHNQLQERQLENSFRVLESVENALLVSAKQSMSTTCSVEVEESLEEIDTLSRNQLRSQVQSNSFISDEQVSRLESLSDLVGKIRAFFPLLSAIFSFMLFEMFKRFLEPFISGFAYLLIRFTS